MKKKIIKIFKIVCLVILVTFIAMIGNGILMLMTPENELKPEEEAPFTIGRITSIETARYRYAPRRLIQNDGTFEITGNLNLEDNLIAIADKAGQSELLFEERQENTEHETVFDGSNGLYYCYEETIEKDVNNLLRSTINKYFGNSTPATLAWEYVTLKDSGSITISCGKTGKFAYERVYADSLYRCDWENYESAEEIRALFQELFPSFLQNDEKRMTPTSEGESMQFETGERWIHMHMELSTDNVTRGVYDGYLIASKDRSEKADKLFNLIDKSTTAARKAAPQISIY